MERGRRRSIGPLLAAALLAGALTAVGTPSLAEPAVGSSPLDVSLISRSDASATGGSQGTTSPDGGYHAFVTSAFGPAQIVVTDDHWLVLDVGRPDVVVDPADPVLSRGGRHVAFSALTDPGDPSVGRTVYTVDLAVRTVVAVETRPGWSAGSPSITDDGETIAYQAWPTTDPAASEVRVWTRSTRRSTVVGAGADGSSSRPAISGDGTTVAFTTRATNLVPGMTGYRSGPATEVVAHNRVTGAFRLVSAVAGTDGGPAPAGDSRVESPDAVSTDGSTVVFTTAASAAFFDPAMPTDGGGDDVVIRSGTTSTLVSRTAAGSACIGDAGSAAVSDVGVVAFASTCTDLAAAVDGGTGTYLADSTGAVVAASHRRGAPEVVTDPQQGLSRPSISADGAVTVFTTTASLTEDEGDDANGQPDVYRALLGEAPPEETVEPEEVTVDEVTAACPAGSRAIRIDYPPLAEWSDGQFGPSVDGTALGHSYAFDADLTGWSATAFPLDVEETGGRGGLRAVAVQGADGVGAVRTLRWDYATRLPNEVSEDFASALGAPDPFVVSAAALCVPSLPGVGPGADDDTATVLAGSVTDIDVLANDDGEIDPTTLTIDSVSLGAAEVVDRGGRRVVSFTAPAGPGVANVVYTVADFDGLTSTATLVVTVRAIETGAFTLDIGPTDVPPDTDVPVTVTVTNDGGDAVTGGIVSFGVRAPGSIQAATGSGWTCAVAPAGTTATCTTDAEVVADEQLPALSFVVRSPNGPQLPCDENDPAGPACIPVRAWNGAVAEEATAFPEPVRAALPYVGGLLRGVVEATSPFVSGEQVTYRVTLSNAGAAALPAGTLVELRPEPGDARFLSSFSASWSCAADTPGRPVAADDEEEPPETTVPETTVPETSGAVDEVVGVPGGTLQGADDVVPREDPVEAPIEDEVVPDSTVPDQTVPDPTVPDPTVPDPAEPHDPAAPDDGSAGESTDRVLCTSLVELPVGSSDTIELVFEAGTGLGVGCPDGVEAPCALLRAWWVDAVVPTIRILLGEASTGVGEPEPDLAPDVMVQLGLPSVVWAGTTASAHVIVANAGLGATTAATAVELALPVGLVATGASGAGWSCTLTDPRSVSCVRSTPLPTGAIAPTVVVQVLVDLAADGGEVMAVVTTEGDPSPLNNTATTPVSVRSGGHEDPNGLGRLSILTEFPVQMSLGSTAGASLVIANNSGTDEPGPTTVTVHLPAGQPAGQVVTATDSGSGWGCDERIMADQVNHLTCTYTGGIVAGGQSTPLALDLTAQVATPGTSVDIRISYLVHETPVHNVRRVAITPRRVARLAVTGRQPVAIRPGGEAPIHFDGRSLGNAAPSTGIDATIDLPAGTTARSVLGDTWTCTGVGTGRLGCASEARPLPGTPMPPLIVLVAAPEGTGPGVADASFRFRTSDEFDERVSAGVVPVSISEIQSGELGIERVGLPQTAAEDRSVSYELVVTNLGAAAANGTLALRERFPIGTSVSGSGDGWTCAQSGPSLVCERPDTELAGTAAAPPVVVAARFPSGGDGGQAQLSATATLGWSKGVAADPVGMPSAAATFVDLRTTVAARPVQLTRGGSGTATLAVSNLGTAAAEGPLTIGAAFSRGITPTAAGGAGWDCAIDASAALAALACTRSTGAAAGASLPPVAVEYQVGFASDRAVFTLGRVEGVGSGDLGSVAAAIAGQGAAALTDPGTDIRPVTGVAADAGDDRDVLERTELAEGGSELTVVTLDGGRSRAGTTRIAARWVQTSGPEVTWLDPAGTTVTAGGAERSYATGLTPSFRIPRLPDDSVTALTFELTATAGASSDSDVVTVTVNPVAGAPTAVSPISTDLPDLVSAPGDGTPVALRLAVDDPEGDPVSVRWSMVATDSSLAGSVVAGGGELITAPGGEATASFNWPTGASYVVIEATASSARSAPATRSLTIGSAPPPPSILVDGPDRVVSSQVVELRADLGDLAPEAVTWQWRQTAGPALDPAILAAASGPLLSFEAPVVTAAGQVLAFDVVATRLAGLSTVAAPASVSVIVDPAPMPDVAIDGPTSTPVDTAVALTVTGAPPGAAIRWRQRSGPAGGFSAANAGTTTFRAPTDGVAAIEVTVTDASGQSASATTQIVVGTPLTGGSGSTGCNAAGSVLNAAFAAAESGVGLAATLGPVSVDLGTVQVENACGGADASVTFLNAGFSLANGTVAGSGLSGRISGRGLCVTNGTLRLPSSWNVSEIRVGTASPVCVGLAAPHAVTGSFSVTGLPLLKLPPGTTPPVTTLDFDGSALAVAAEVPLLGGTLDLSLTVDTRTGRFTGAAGGRFVVLGAPVDVGGTISYDGTRVDVSVEGGVAGTIDLGAGTTLADARLRFDREGVAIEGTVGVAGAVTLTARGSFTDAQNWSFALTGTAGAGSWTPVPGLTVQPAELSGRVERVAGRVTFDVAVAVPGAWTPVDGLAVRRIVGRLSNQPAPPGCPSVTPGSVWFQITGQGTADLGASSLVLNVEACVAPGQGAWSLGSSASADAWAPFDQFPASLESVGIRAGSAGGGAGVELMAFGLVRVMGLGLGATITSAGGSVVVDGSGDLSAVGEILPAGSSGHVVLASAPRPGYRLRNATALGRLDPAFTAPIPIPKGISFYTGFDLPQELRTFMQESMGLPDVASVVLALETADPTLRATIAFGEDDPVVLHESCGNGAAPCAPDAATRLSLKALTLSVGLKSGFGFRADGRLDLPASDQTAASSVDLAAAISVDIPSQTLTAMLSGEGRWHDALGIDGLVLDSFGAEFGITLTAPIPRLGVRADVAGLPGAMADALGVQTPQEKIRFALNLSLANPIFHIQIGEHDGGIALDLLEPLGAADVIEVDDANLLIAPFGGSIAGRTYPAGVFLDFAADIGGVPVDAAFSFNLQTLRVAGQVEVGRFNVAGVGFDDLRGGFDLQPQAGSFAMEVGGNVDLGAVGGGGTVGGRLSVAVGGRNLSAEIDLAAANLGVKDFLEVKDFRLHGTLDVTVGSSPNVDLDLAGTATLFGADVGVAGAASFANGKVQHLAAALAVDMSSPGFAVTGTGCAAPYQALNGGRGACISFDTAQGRADLNATLVVGATELEITGALNKAFIAISGTLRVAEVGAFSVSGTLYHGTAAQLTGYGAEDLTGVWRQVQTNDVVVTSSLTTASLGGFDASLSASVRRVGGSSGAMVAGSVTLPGGSTLAGSALLTVADGQTFFEFTATGSLNLGGYQVAAAEVRVARLPSRTVATFSAMMTLPFGTGEVRVDGGFAPRRPDVIPGRWLPASYVVSGSGIVSIGGVTGTAALTLSSAFGLEFQFDLRATTIFGVTLHGYVDPFGHGSITTSLAVSPVRLTLTLELGPSSGALTGSLTYKGYTFARVRIGGDGFDVNMNVALHKTGSKDFRGGSVGGGVHGQMNLAVAIRRQGNGLHFNAHFAGAFAVYGWLELAGGRFEVGAGLRFDSYAGVACLDIRVHEVCIQV